MQGFGPTCGNTFPGLLRGLKQRRRGLCRRAVYRTRVFLIRRRHHAGGIISDLLLTGVQLTQIIDLTLIGPIELGNGDRVLVAKQLIADEKTQGSVSVQFKTKFTPNASEGTKSYTIDSNPWK